MRTLIVVDNPKHWPIAIEGAEVVTARSYLLDRPFSDIRRAAVFNMCRSYAYQTLGYYVSLLATARGHRPLPSVTTLQGFWLAPIVRLASDDLEELIERNLAPLRSAEFDLSIYFGKNVARRYDRLSRALFNQFPAPFLRARFERDDGWRLKSIRPIPASEIPESHREFVVEQARDYFRRPARASAPQEFRYDLAILWSEDDPSAPSDARAIRRFIRAARSVGIGAETMEPNEAGRIAEYDALFIRETTRVDHHTYRLARRAAAEGLVVIDDPESIIRCTNKVYQAELFARHGIACPRTVIASGDNLDEIGSRVRFPCVIKRPDSAFSVGVARADSPEALRAALATLFDVTELAVIQEWTPSEFDWRIGVLDRRALFAARYYMAKGHWQIAAHEEGGRRFGKVQAVALADVPQSVLELGVRAASLFGEGLYGVDLKLMDERPLVIEVNDNPNIDAGAEDAVEKDDLYLEIARTFRRRLDQRGGS
ncbi:MAG: RimK family protein [Gemmatimonadota bacterium]